MGLWSLLASCSFKTGVNKGIHLMPEAIGKGVAYYISSIKAVASEPFDREPIEPISRREPSNTRSVEISIS